MSASISNPSETTTRSRNAPGRAHHGQAAIDHVRDAIDRIIQKIAELTIDYAARFEPYLKGYTPTVKLPDGRTIRYRYIPPDDNEPMMFALINPEEGVREFLEGQGARIVRYDGRMLQVQIPRKWIHRAHDKKYAEQYEELGKIILVTDRGFVMRGMDENGEPITTYLEETIS